MRLLLHARLALAAPMIARLAHVGPSLFAGPQRFMEWPAPHVSALQCRSDRRRGSMIKSPIAVLGIDLGKNSCSVVGLSGTGEVVLCRRMPRATVVTLGASVPPCIMAM